MSMPAARRLFFFLVASIALLAQAETLPLTPSVARPAPAFSLQDINGKTHTLADYKDKVLVVNFWATWCAPCIKEMPSLQRAWEHLRESNIEVIAINMGETQEDIMGFLEKRPVEFPLLLDTEMSQSAEWKIKGLPTTFIIDGAGQIVYTVIGDKEWDDPVILEQISAVKASN